MLRRKDLVEQFSLVVKQEIKNHQDARLATNLALNSLREQMAMLSARFSSVFNEMENSLKLQEIRQDRLEKAFVEDRDRRAAGARDVESLYKKMMVAQESLSYKLFECQNQGDEFLHKFDMLFALDVNQVEQYEKLCKQIDNDVQRIEAEIIQQVSTAKREIIEMPSEIESMKKELANKIDSYRVDSKGIIRELAVFKKTLFVIEKELENVNTQIDRLKKPQEEA